MDTAFKDDWPPRDTMIAAIESALTAAVEEERQACADISPNDLDITADQMPYTVWTKYRKAILARGTMRQGGAR